MSPGWRCRVRWIVAAGGLTALAIGGVQAQDAERTAGAAFKNIRVLSDVKESDIPAAMNLMAGSLGVTCEYCHVNPWDADVRRPKQVAREMLAMMRRINAENFAGKPVVTCFTCHRGATVPVGLASLDRAGWARSPGTTSTPSAAALPTTRAVLERHRAAVLGVNGRAPATLALRGTLTTRDGMRPPQSSSIEILLDETGNRIVDAATNSRGTTRIGFDGSDGWVADSSGVHDLPARLRVHVLDTISNYSALKVPNLAGEVVGVAEVDGTPCVEVRQDLSPAREQHYFFDTTRGLLRRKVTITNTVLGASPEQADFTDYRDVAGTQLPFTIVISAFSVREERTFTSVDAAVSLPDETFRRPQPPPPRPR